MEEHANPLEILSAALTERSAAARDSVVAVKTSERQHVTGTLWQSHLIVASNQTLPQSEEFEAVFPGGDILYQRDRRTGPIS